jgi:hypothetical protein
MEKVRRVIFSVRLLTFYMRDFVPIRMVIYGKVNLFSVEIISKS